MLSKLIDSIRQLYAGPKRSEAIGRFMHTFASAAGLAFLGLVFSGSTWTLDFITKCVTLLNAAVVLFFYGLSFFKELDK